jgi:hypothetical protein
MPSSVHTSEAEVVSVARRYSARAGGYVWGDLVAAIGEFQVLDRIACSKVWQTGGSGPDEPGLSGSLTEDEDVKIVLRGLRGAGLTR